MLLKKEERSPSAKPQAAGYTTSRNALEWAVFFVRPKGDGLAKKLLAIVAVMLLSVVAAGAQSNSTAAAGGGANSNGDSGVGPEKGGNEIEFWSGGGPSIPGGIRGLGVWNAGFRYGWVLTAPHGPGFLRGEFETGVDAIPFFWVLQPGGTARGIALVPAVLKWDFVQRGRVVPYFDIDGSVLWTSRNTPPGINNINFTPSASLGAHFLLHKYAVTAEFRFLHISDASLTKINPGINTAEIRMGFGLFTHRKQK